MSIPSLSGNLPPLVGRERELAVLRQHLDAAISGHGSLVLIGGEAGIGKTALAEVVCREAEAHGALVLTGRCFDLAETPPYGPWIELFGRYRRDGGPAVPDAFAKRGTVGAVTSQTALFQQVLDFFAALSAARPVMLLLDDLHWVDPASLDLVRFVARSLPDMMCLVLASYRDDEALTGKSLYSLLPTLVHEARAVRLNLPALQPSDVRDLAHRRYSLPLPDLARLTANLDARAEGNPFFVGELLRTLEETRMLHPSDDGGWHLGDMTLVPMPTLVRQVIAARVARLGDRVREMLAVAAVVGQEVPIATWQTVLGCDDDELFDVMEHAMAVRLLEVTPDGVYARFVHAMIRETLYEGMLPPRRARVHLAVAEALIGSGAPDPDTVADHYRRAGDVRAVAWLVKAGERAQRVYAWLTAAARFEAAAAIMAGSEANAMERGWLLVRLAWLRRFADPSAGITPLEQASLLAARINDSALAANALFFRGILRCRTQDFRHGLAELTAGVAALDALPLAEWMQPRLSANADVPVDGESHRGSLALWLAYSGHYDDALVTARRVTARDAPAPIEGGREVGLHTEAYYALGIVHAALGRPGAARAAFARARAAARANRDQVAIGQTTLHELEWAMLPYHADLVAERHALATEAERAWSVGNGALDAGDPPRLTHLPNMHLDGQWAEARQLAQSVRLASKGAARRLLAARVLGALARHLGEPDFAWTLIREWLPVGQSVEPGDNRFLEYTVLHRLAIGLALDARDLPTAHEWLVAHDRWLVWGTAVLGRAEGCLLWADYHRAAGDQTLAHRSATDALALATEPRQPLALLAAHRLLGEIETDAAQFDTARAHLDVALALADACAAPYERALALLALADLQAGSGKLSDARFRLHGAREICLSLGARPALARCDALMARLGDRPPRREGFPDRLTTREVDVLQLLAGGKTNKEMGEALFLSARTVERHIANIYAKVGAHGRADAAAYAVRNGIAPS
ncbi:MAG: helix-turn-helix transcriptional regulator [Thermomicrobiales bacterium]